MTIAEHQYTDRVADFVCDRAAQPIKMDSVLSSSVQKALAHFEHVCAVYLSVDTYAVHLSTLTMP
jgi:hypothetical protein